MASIGDMIRVRAPPYIIKAENFRIMRVPGNKIVSSEVKQTNKQTNKHTYNT